MMKKTGALLVSLSLVLLAACSSLRDCCGCNQKEACCGECGQTEACCGECGGEEACCGECGGSEACKGCATLSGGGTGWCADCGKGFNAGREVNCTESCMASPGGQPCTACVK